MKIIRLSRKFYEQYKNCDEIMRKSKRPYYCLEVRVKNITYAIPLRHHIKHPHAFITIGNAGLDYTKAIVIHDQSMISPDEFRIDTAEWRLIASHENDIYIGFAKYLRLFYKALNKMHVPKYRKIIQYSALQYFINKEIYGVQDT